MVFPERIVLGSDSILWHSTLWSVVCEEMYYAIYPLLNRLSVKIGWRNIIAATFIISILMSWHYFNAIDWHDVGIILTAIILFPVWLMGCYLAEGVSGPNRPYSAPQIWLWRIAAVVIMWVALVLHFHLGIYQTQSALWIGVLYYFWIRAEIGYYKMRTPWKVLVWAGGWSYSLYLIHPIVIDLCYRYGIRAAESRLDWLIVIALVLLASYGFYLVVERPSHNQARKIPLFDRGRKPLPATAAEAR
jgi:peptidoglycan/LPS O-acetylase OafA/YrhL